MKLKRNTIFLIDREKDKPDGKLRYRIKWNGNTVAFNVGYRVEFDKWSTDTQRCKNNTTHGKKKIPASQINKEINRYEAAANNVFDAFQLSGTTPTADEFRASFSKEIGREVEISNKALVVEALKQYILEMRREKQWANGTYAKHSSLLNRLTEYNDKATFREFNHSGLVDYHLFLINEKNYSNTTIKKEFQITSGFFNWAVKNNHCSELAYIDFKPQLKIAENPVVFLEWDELHTMYNHQFSLNEEYLTRVRDVFCFCCFTGLRYSDVANLRRSDVFDDYISVTTIKAVDTVKIELNNYSREILDKYSSVIYEGNLALPIISNQKMNDYLKEIGKACKIDRPIKRVIYKGSAREEVVLPKHDLMTTHMGRRTFICNALMLGITPHTIMKWTGHSDYEAMKPYIDVADKAKAEAMNLFNKKSPSQKIGD